MKKKRSSGRRDGNVTLDLGEQLEARLAGKTSQRGRPYRPLGRRPGMFGYRPGWSTSARSGGWKLGQTLGLQRTLDTKDALGGVIIGTIGNRVLYRLTPSVIPTTSKLVVDAVNFGVGLLPWIFKKDSLTAGIALPGLVFLAGSVSDWALDLAGMSRPALSGLNLGLPNRSAAGGVGAREKLQAIQQRMRGAAPQGRVFARSA